jgi:hypothetical protein
MNAETWDFLFKAVCPPFRILFHECNYSKNSVLVGLNIRKKELSVKQRNHKCVNEAGSFPGKGKDSIGP